MTTIEDDVNSNNNDSDMKFPWGMIQIHPYIRMYVVTMGHNANTYIYTYIKLPWDTIQTDTYVYTYTYIYMYITIIRCFYG